MRHARFAKYVVAVSMIGLFAMPFVGRAQDDTKQQMKLDLAAARANKKALVGANMNLTDAQAKAFWPIYDAYEAQMEKLEDRHAAEVNSFVKSFQAMTDEQANKKLDEVMEIKQARLNVQKEFIPKFRAAVTGVQATRFFQIDNKLQALTQCALAQALPLVQGKGEAQPQQ
ncbi:MAG TPA: hypothetical protein VMT61_06385 [Candidatus Binataceae bacterium]|nr:hypothetical protein [Candidatus Binataceae bacterium]